MASTGNRLEELVAFVEEKLLPKGFSVKTNQCLFNDDGVQIAEFDVEIRGRVGSTDIAWLIECRDRPGSGAQPSSWIEQLVGRQDRFRFNKVTAVSTTGFAPGAIAYAISKGIELRRVSALSPEDFDWLQLREYRLIERVPALKHARLLIDRSESEDRRDAFQAVVRSALPTDQLLRCTRTGEYKTIPRAFTDVLTGQDNLFEGLEPNGGAKGIQLLATFSSDDDHYEIITAIGPIRVRQILFKGELSLRETLVPLLKTQEYAQFDSGRSIAQFASFAPHDIAGKRVSLEIHRIPDSDEIQLVLRHVSDDD